MPRSLPYFFFWWEREEEECSGGIHRTFQNRMEILSAARISVGLHFEIPLLGRGLKHIAGGEECCYF